MNLNVRVWEGSSSLVIPEGIRGPEAAKAGKVRLRRGHFGDCGLCRPPTNKKKGLWDRLTRTAETMHRTSSVESVDGAAFACEKQQEGASEEGGDHVVDLNTCTQVAERRRAGALICVFHAPRPIETCR